MYIKFLLYCLYDYTLKLYLWHAKCVVFQDEGAPERTVKVGLESISLDSWSRLIQYNMFRELLGSGMTAHIQGNELLREVFQMGPAPLTTVESKASRLERVRDTWITKA